MSIMLEVAAILAAAVLGLLWLRQATHDTASP
jgi:hypothetical protein